MEESSAERAENGGNDEGSTETAEPAQTEPMDVESEAKIQPVENGGSERQEAGPEAVALPGMEQPILA